MISGRSFSCCTSALTTRREKSLERLKKSSEFYTSSFT